MIPFNKIIKKLNLRLWIDNGDLKLTSFSQFLDNSFISSLFEHILDDYDPHIFIKDHRNLNNRFKEDQTELIETIENKYKVILN